MYHVGPYVVFCIRGMGSKHNWLVDHRNDESGSLCKLCESQIGLLFNMSNGIDVVEIDFHGEELKTHS